MIVMT